MINIKEKVLVFKEVSHIITHIFGYTKKELRPFQVRLALAIFLFGLQHVHKALEAELPVKEKETLVQKEIIRVISNIEEYLRQAQSTEAQDLYDSNSERVKYVIAQLEKLV